MRILAWVLIAATVVLFALQGGLVGDIYDPLWIWLEPKLGLGWGTGGVIVEAVIVYAPAFLGAWILWRQNRKARRSR